MKPLRTAFVFPGQGSHRAGMATATGPRGRAAVEALGRAAGLDLVRLADDPEACAATAVGQPAIHATSIALLGVLRDAGVTPDVVAGHSLGEVTAAVAAGVLAPADAARLVAERGRSMGEACRSHPGGMAAVVRLDLHDVSEVLARHDGVAVANHNAPGQVVIAGPTSALEDAVVELRQLGGRAIPLRVEGAFHSPAMAPAVVAVERELSRLSVREPVVPLVSGMSGRLLHASDEIVRSLVDGVLAPVSWIEVHRRLVELGVQTIVEVGPGGVLAALARRAGDVTVHAVASAADAEAVAETLARRTSRPVPTLASA